MVTQWQCDRCGAEGLSREAKKTTCFDWPGEGMEHFDLRA